MTGTPAGASFAVSDDRFRLAMESAAVGMALVTPDGRILEANAALAAFLGSDLAALIGAAWQDATHPDDVEGESVLVSRLLAGQIDSFRRRKRYVRPDATVVWGDLSVSCVREDGAVRYSIVQVVDVTEAVSAEEALAASEAMFRGAFDESPDPIVVYRPVFGPDGRFADAEIRYANATARMRWLDGLDARAVEGLLLFARWPAARDDLFDAYARVVETGDAIRFDLDGRSRSGNVGDVTLVPFPGGFIHHTRDVTDRRAVEAALRASEERHRFIAENALDVIWTMAPDGRITYLSPSVESLRGFTVAEAMAQAVDEILTPDSAAESTAYFVSMLADVAAGRRPAPYRGEQEYRCKDGSTVWCDVMAYPILAPDGSLVELLGVSRDLGERKRHEAALIAARDAAQAALADLAEAQRIAHVGSWTWDPVADRSTWSDEFCRIAGVPPGSPAPTVDKGPALYTPETWSTLAAALERAVGDGTPYEVLVGIVRPDGTVRDAIARAEVERDASGTVILLRGTVLDVTDARRAEEALRASEARYAELVASVPIGVFTARTRADGSSSLDFASPRARILAGLGDAKDGRPFGGVHPDDAPALVALLTSLHADPRPVEWEGRVLVGDEERWIRIGSTPGRLDGDDLLTQGYVQDITDERHADDALRAREVELEEAQRIAGVGSWTLVPDGRDTWSDEMYRIHGLEPGSWIPTFAEYERMIGSASFTEMTRRVADALASGAPYTMEFDVTRPDGSVRRVVSRATVMRDADGRIVGLRGTHQDVTGERELETRLRQGQRLEAVGQLAGGIAHDFNNLLAAIRGSAELLRDELPSDAAAQEDVDEVLRAADRAAALTRQLLAFSRRQPLRPEVVDPAAVVASLAPMLGRLLGEHIDLVVTRGDDACLVSADPSQLEQVVMNLAVNARDAMPDGGRLAIDVRAADCAPARGDADADASPCVRITVSDTGAGIDPSVLPRIFEPFFTTKGPGEGSGMGLATVYGIVGASGGTISVASRPGEGTTFTIDLPRVEGVASPEGAAGTASAVARPPATRPAVAGTLLLVEDEPAVRRVTARMLRELGYAVIDAGGPEAALTLNDDVLACADALVTDVIMPGMHGPGLADRIEERRGRPIATVFISGYAPDVGLTERLERPGHAFVGKPFTRESLATAVRAATATATRPTPGR